MVSRATKRFRRIATFALAAWAAIFIVLALHTAQRSRKPMSHFGASFAAVKRDMLPMQPRIGISCRAGDFACVDDVLRIMRNRPDGWLNRSVTFVGEYLPASFIDDMGNSDVPTESDLPLPPARIR